MDETLAVPKTERADAAANRARIVAAARAVFARQGADAEVREIADVAGVGVGTLYRHFASREDLLVGILQQTIHEALERLRTAVAIPDPRAAMRAIMHAAAETHAQFGALMDVMHDAKLMKRGKSEAPLREASDLVAGVLDRGIYTGVFRADLDIPVTVAFIMANNVFSMPIEDRTSTEIADTIADLILAAIEAR